MITLGLATDDRTIIVKPDTRKFRLYVMAQVAGFKKSLAPIGIMLSMTDLESAFDGKAPSYVSDGWKKLLVSMRDLQRDLDRWESDEKDLTDGQKPA